MKARSVKVLAVALAVVAVAAVAGSQTVVRTHAHRGFEGRMLGFMTDYLDLTEAQQAQVKQIMATERPTVMPLVQQLAQARHQLRQLEESGAFDEAKVRALAAQQTQTMTELIVAKARIKSEIFNVLTPDQKAKAVKFMDRREARFSRHMQDAQQQAPTQQ
jgi:Spy/CpxP family protein refolding chaperone